MGKGKRIKEAKKEEAKVQIEITCPNCNYGKGMKGDFLMNKDLNCAVCTNCGILFMNALLAKQIFQQANSKIIQPTPGLKIQ